MQRLAQLTPLIPLWQTPYGQRRQIKRIIQRTYASWRNRFPRWVNAGFDEYFLLHDALPLLNAMLVGGCYPEPARLAQRWATAFGISQERTARAVAEVTPVAADFIARLQIEYYTQSTACSH